MSNQTRLRPAATGVERIPVLAIPNKHNVRYLETKRTKMGHLLG